MNNGILMILGVTGCVAGQRFFRFFIAAAGFLAGAWAAQEIVIRWLFVPPGSMIFVQLIGGAVGVLLSAVATQVGVFAMGAGVGLAVGAVLQRFLALEREHLLIAICGGAIAGLLFQRTMVILATASLGSAIFVSAGQRQFGDAGQGVALILWLGLTIAGVLIQSRGRRRRESALGGALDSPEIVR